MQGSHGYVIWTVCYLIALWPVRVRDASLLHHLPVFEKPEERTEAVPAGSFESLPKVTVQLPIFNEIYVVERLLRSVSEIDYPRDSFRSRCSTIRPTTLGR